MPIDKEQLMTDRDYKVVKSNTLIQKTRFNLSTQEQKIILYLLTKIKPADNDLHLYDFQIKDFCEVCGIDETSGKNYTALKTAIKKLADKSLWLKLDNGSETLLRWIEKPYIHKKNGVIQILLDKDMKPYLLQLKEHFTQYNLYYVLAMKSQYSIRLYELLKSYEYKKTCLFDIDEFKKQINAEKYQRHADFTRYVLEPAIKEINQYGDISISYDLKKTGRRFSQINFYIKTKKDIKERLETWANIEKKLNPKQISGQIGLFAPKGEEV